MTPALSLIPLDLALMPPIASPPSASDVVAPYMGVFFLSFAVAFIATPVMRWIANRWGVLDQPDSERKRHARPIAYLGGVALFLGWLAGIAMSYRLAPAPASLAWPGQPIVAVPLTIVFGALVVHVTGLVDDIWGVIPRVKVGGQLIAAAAIAYHSDIGRRLVSDLVASVGLTAPDWACYLIGIIALGAFIVGACNAMNLLDGMDGLAAGTSAVTGIGLLAICVIVALTSLPTATHLDVNEVMAHHWRIVLCLALIGSALGFLPYNFHPANIFMGDAGSLLLGYLCVTTILYLAIVPGNSTMFVAAALIVFGLPIADTMQAIVRRLTRGQSIFHGDHQHIHHRLLARGWGVRRVAVALYLAVSILAVIGACLALLRYRFILAFCAVFFGFVIVQAYKGAQAKERREN